MDSRLSFVTLIVQDLAATRRFYVDGLGWAPELDVPGEVLMVRVAERVVLSFWSADHAQAEIGPVSVPHGNATAARPAPPVTLAHNVATPGQVDEVLEEARVAGASVVHAGEHRAWGGYSGYFADPDGFWWEVAFNPGPVGQSVLP